MRAITKHSIVADRNTAMRNATRKFILYYLSGTKAIKLS
jgi:hypothetical protein